MAERAREAPGQASEHEATPESEPASGGVASFLSQRFGAAGAHRIIQRRMAARGRADASPGAVQAAAAEGVSGAGSAMPHLDAIQRSFGQHDLSSVKAHGDAAAVKGATAMGAEAFASGEHVAFAQAPSLHTAAHEAAHVVQQRGGVRPAGGVGQEGDAHERHADAVADKVVRGESAAALLGAHAGAAAPVGGAVQRKPKAGATNTVEIKTDDYALIVDGHQVSSDTEAVADGGGDTRYVHVGGVGDCYCFAYQGTRKSDGKTATLVAHISSQQYLRGEVKNVLPGRVSTFLKTVNNVHAIAVTNYDHDKDMSKPATTKMVLMPEGISMHNTQYPRDKKATAKKGAYATYIVDTDEFDIHGAGSKISGESAVEESVSAFMNEAERVAERQKAASCSPCVIL